MSVFQGCFSLFSLPLHVFMVTDWFIPVQVCLVFNWPCVSFSFYYYVVLFQVPEIL